MNISGIRVPPFGESSKEQVNIKLTLICIHFTKWWEDLVKRWKVLEILPFKQVSWLSVSQWVSEWVSCRGSESVGQWISESVSESMSQWVSESVSESVSQWVSEWVSQSVSQSVSQCVSQSFCQPDILSLVSMNWGMVNYRIRESLSHWGPCLWIWCSEISGLEWTRT